MSTLHTGASTVLRFEHTESNPAGVVGAYLTWKPTKTTYVAAISSGEIQLIRWHNEQQTVIARKPVDIALHVKYWIRFETTYKPWHAPMPLIVRVRCWRDQSEPESDEWNRGEPEIWLLECYEHPS